MKSKFSIEEIMEMVKEVEEGASYNSVAKKHGTSHPSVKWYCDKYKIKSEHLSYIDKKKLSQEEIDEIVAKVSDGVPMSTVALEYNVFSKAIIYHVKKSNIGNDIKFSEIEKNISKDLRSKKNLSAADIAMKYSISIEQVRNICSERNWSLRTKKGTWNIEETNCLIDEINLAKQEHRKIRISMVADMVGRTPMAVSVKVQRLYEQDPSLKA